MKKRRKKHYKRRLLIYTLLVFFISFSIVDYYFETEGIPPNLAKYLKEKLRSKGLIIFFDKAKIGVINGLLLINPTLYDNEIDDYIFKADRLKIGVALSLFDGRYFRINSFDVVHGSLNVPIFPEAGAEGRNDKIKINSIDATINFHKKHLELEYLSGELSPFKFSAAGNINNIFFNILKDKKKKQPRNKSFTIVPLIKKISYTSRKMLFRQLLTLKKINFKDKRPECSLVFDFPESKRQSNIFNFTLQAPSFKYGSFDINTLDAALSLKKDVIYMNKLTISFPGGGEIHSTGFIDLFEYKITGKAKVIALPSEMDRIIKFEDYKIPVLIQLHEKPIILSATLDQYSFSSDIFHGAINIKIPSLHVETILINDLELDLLIEDNKIAAKSFSLSTTKNRVFGNFEYFPKSECLDVHATANGTPILFKKFMKGENRKLLAEIVNSFTFPPEENDVQYIFDLHVDFRETPFYHVSSKIAMQDFRYNGIFFKSGSTQIIFDSNALIIVPGIVLQRKDLFATVSIAYDGTNDFHYRQTSPKFKSNGLDNNRLIAEIDGNFPGENVLVAIFPKWHSKILNLNQSMPIKAHGEIDFNEMSNTSFIVKIDDATCFWKDIPVDNFKADLMFEGLDMELKNGEGKVYNGDIELNYKYNFRSLKGYIDLMVSDANFAPIAKYLGHKLPDPNVGELSLSTKANLHYNKKGDIFMDGAGQLSITNADLWDIPIINECGEFTAKWIGKDWGNLTTLDADFQFIDDHVYSDNIHTDGTVISLSGYGSYYWHTENFDFRIKSKVLERALPFKIISNIFTPLSSLFESRVYRKNGKIKWEKSYSIKKLF